MCYAREVPRFQPFLGVRYNGDLAPAPDVIAPPYDVVDDAERARLAARSPYNAIHVELPVEDATRGLDRYGSAAALFGEWQQVGALGYDEEPSLYLYRMRYTDETGVDRSTTGVIGALAMDVTGEGSVLPHERTMPKPKGDRLDLLRATGFNTSPIWGLSLAAGLTEACIAAAGERVPTVATDDDGVIHELIPVDDPDAIAAITRLVASTPVVIADGHHRYETATFYRAERREHGAGDGGHDLVMALVVELTPDELFVQPIHRLISGLPNGFDFLAALEPFFTVTPGPSDPAELTRAMAEGGGLGLCTAEGSWVLVPRPVVLERAEADLDSSRLDVALAEFPSHELVYQHGARIARGAVDHGSAQAAVLLRPATVPQIADTAHSGRRMPPKTTFFYPKPRTGFVYRKVDEAVS